MLHHLCCDEWLFASVVLSEPLSKRNCYTDVVCFTYGVSTQFLVFGRAKIPCRPAMPHGRSVCSLQYEDS